MRLGITTGYLCKYGTAEGAQRMRAHGYDCVDYNRFINTEEAHFQLSDAAFKDFLIEERRHLDDAGITVYQTHGPWRYPPQDGTTEARAERFAAMTRAIRGSAYLGARVMVIHPLMPFGANSAESPEIVREMNLEFFDALCDVAEEYGMVLGYENMPFSKHPLHSVRQVTEIAQKINRKSFGICLDTGHCLCSGGSIAEAVREIGGELLVSLHVHDNDGKGDQHGVPGTGIGDWEGFATALREVDFSGVLSLETKFPNFASVREQEEAELAMARIGAQLCERTRA